MASICRAQTPGRHRGARAIPRATSADADSRADKARLMTQLPSQSDHNDPWGGAGTDAFSTPGTEPAAFSAAGYGHTYGGGMDDADGGAVHYLQVLYRRRYLAASTFLAVFLGVALYTFTAV